MSQTITPEAIEQAAIIQALMQSAKPAPKGAAAPEPNNGWRITSVTAIAVAAAWYALHAILYWHVDLSDAENIATIYAGAWLMASPAAILGAGCALGLYGVRAGAALNIGGLIGLGAVLHTALSAPGSYLGNAGRWLAAIAGGA